MRPYLPVLNKRDFTLRYAAGEFGNASPTWLSLGAFRQYKPQGYGELFHLRNGFKPGGMTFYKQSQSAVFERWANMETREQSNWYCSMQVPPEVEATLLIQGEVMRTERGLYLYYSTIAKPMREALKERADSVYGIMSSSLLWHYLCPNSYEWLMELLDRYPDHVAEFSTFGRPWGTLYPRFNTVFWETRLY